MKIVINKKHLLQFYKVGRKNISSKHAVKSPAMVAWRKTRRAGTKKTCCKNDKQGRRKRVTQKGEFCWQKNVLRSDKSNKKIQRNIFTHQYQHIYRGDGERLLMALSLFPNSTNLNVNTPNISLFLPGHTGLYQFLTVQFISLALFWYLSIWIDSKPIYYTGLFCSIQ